MHKLLPLLFICSLSLADTKTVAISYFDNTSGTKEYDPLSKGLADMLITDLSNVKSLKIVEREKLESLLKEIELGDGKFIDPNTAQKLGKGLGAGFMLTGSFLIMGETMRIDARLVDVGSGRVIMAEKVTGKSNEFWEMERALANLLIDKLELKNEIYKKPQVPSIDLSALVVYSEAVDLGDKGSKGRAITLLRDLQNNHPEFTIAKDRLDKYLLIIESRKAARLLKERDERERIRQEWITKSIIEKEKTGEFKTSFDFDKPIKPQLKHIFSTVYDKGGIPNYPLLNKIIMTAKSDIINKYGSLEKTKEEGLNKLFDEYEIRILLGLGDYDAFIQKGMSYLGSYPGEEIDGIYIHSYLGAQRVSSRGLDEKVSGSGSLDDFLEKAIVYKKNIRKESIIKDEILRKKGEAVEKSINYYLKSEKASDYDFEKYLFYKDLFRENLNFFEKFNFIYTVEAYYSHLIKYEDLDECDWLVRQPRGASLKKRFYRAKERIEKGEFDYQTNGEYFIHNRHAKYMDAEKREYMGVIPSHMPPDEVEEWHSLNPPPKEKTGIFQSSKKEKAFMENFMAWDLKRIDALKNYPRKNTIGEDIFGMTFKEAKDKNKLRDDLVLFEDKLRLRNLKRRWDIYCRYHGYEDKAIAIFDTLINLVDKDNDKIDYLFKDSSGKMNCKYHDNELDYLKMKEGRDWKKHRCEIYFYGKFVDLLCISKKWYEAYNLTKSLRKSFPSITSDWIRGDSKDKRYSNFY